MQPIATSKRLSCGIVIVNQQHELLLCHVTGRGHWDLPKGGIDADETPIDAALRETREETGIVLAADELTDLGRFAFSERKELHLFATRMQRFDVAPRLYFVLLVPDLEIETARARRILPSKISRVAAVENCANACAITAAFASRDYEKMRGTFSDNLHQPFRAKLIQFLPRVIAAAERAGALGAFLSGSGSAIAAVTLQAPEKVATAMARAAAAPARTIIAHADNRGAQVLPVRNQRSAIHH